LFLIRFVLPLAGTISVKRPGRCTNFVPADNGETIVGG